MSKYIFGVDVGGTTIKIGLFDTKGILLDKWGIKTDKSNNGQNILCDITASLNEKIEQKHIQKDNILGVGLGVPGPVDSNGVVYKCVNLGWDVFNVSETLEKLSGLKVKVANDANAAALGEMWQGGGKGYNNVVLITLGTGVGGGIIIDGKIVSGINGAAGELGHMPIIIENGERCGCGKEGCLETVASATGIVRETKKYLKKTDEQSLLRKLENITAKDIFDMAKKK